jgi:hypothetical protein
MLDLMVIFLVAGLLLGAALESTQGKDEKPLSPGERERMRLKLALDRPSESTDDRRYLRPQLIAAAVFFALGILYALCIPGITDSKLLPSATLGLLAGVIVRLGLRTMSPYFLAVGAVFMILPFLLSQGVGMLKNFNRVKLGWFEADIASTAHKTPVQLQLQTLEDRSIASGFIALSDGNIDLLLASDELARNICNISKCSDPVGIAKDGSIALYNVSSGATEITGLEFYHHYIKPILAQIAAAEDESLSTERSIREIVDPVAKAGAALLKAGKAPTDAAWQEAWCRFVDEVRTAESKLAQIKSPGSSTMSDTPGCVSGTPSDVTLIPGRTLAQSALPHILISRIYRRAGSDTRALRVLENAEGIVLAEDMNDLSRSADWAALMIERGELRHSLGIKEWKDDFGRAIDRRESILDHVWSQAGNKLTTYEIIEECRKNPDPHSRWPTVARLEVDTAQLRNRYVFALIEDGGQRRQFASEEAVLDDVVTRAQQNYLNMKKLSSLARCLEPSSNPDHAPCIDVVYPDTYALALIASTPREDPAGIADMSTQIHQLLRESVEAAQKGPENNCPKRQAFLPVIKNHQKLARTLTQ